MRSSCQLSLPLSQLLLLVMVWRSEVSGQPCPSGQITHHDRGMVRCCRPTNCQPNQMLMYCKQNGTSDTCEACPSQYGLYKRTSSFAVEPCHMLLVSKGVGKKCVNQTNTEASIEDMKNCLCNLEQGLYFYKPQLPVGPTSYCQPIPEECRPGSQPNQKGKCEPCPPNTVQNKKGFMLCWPQKNCTALRLETKIAGSASTEAVCAEPPPQPPVSTTSPVVVTTAKPRPSPSPKSTTPAFPDASVRTVVGSESDASLIAIVAVVCSLFIIVCLVVFFVCRRKGWLACVLKGKCNDVERSPGSGSQMPLSSRGDNDNTSDNSCYTCTDSCLATSNKSSSSSNNGAAKSSAASCEATKAQRPPSMLEAYMNMNGKGPDSFISCSSNGLMSEPFYNSIGQGDKLTGGDNMPPSYKNANNGFCPSGLRQHHPNRVRLVSSSDDDNDSMKSPLYAQVQPRSSGVARKDRGEDCSETDPLLPHSSENGSSGVPTPVSTPALKGILRNNNGGGGNNNRQDGKRNRAGESEGGVGVAGAGEGGNGNRPHLSMLLNAPEDTSHMVAEESQANANNNNNNNIPCLSQLMSAQRSVQATTPGPPPLSQPQHHQQQQQLLLQQQQAPLPEPRGPQRGLQGSPMAARLVPVSLATAQQPQLNPSLVQMEELKPIPLSPGGPPPAALLPSPMGDTTTGAGMTDRERSQSPARITPTQQVMRGAPPTTQHRHAAVLPEESPGATAPTAEDTTVKKGLEPALGPKEETDVKTLGGTSDDVVVKEISEETFRKQALPVTCGEETMQKSVCGSSGLGDSLEFSSPLELPSQEEDGRSRTMYRRSNSEASRSVSPPPLHQLPPSRSNSTPEEKHRPFAVVKPMQSDQSLNTMSDSQDRLSELTQHLDAVGRNYPLTSLAGRSPARQISQTSSEGSEQMQPKTTGVVPEEEEDFDSSEREGETSDRVHGGGNDSTHSEGSDREDH